MIKCISSNYDSLLANSNEHNRVPIVNTTLSCLVNFASSELVDTIINNFSGDEIKESDENDIVETFNQLEAPDKINMNTFAIDFAGLINLPKVNLEDLSPISCLIKLHKIIDQIELLNSVIKTNTDVSSKQDKHITELESSNAKIYCFRMQRATVNIYNPTING